MSFGFSVSDFIAASELCWHLYREVYKVARNAPAEVQALHKELSGMSNVLKALVEDVQNPDSSVAQAGPDRIQLTNEIITRTRDILKDISDTMTRFDSLYPTKNVDSKPSSLKQYCSRIKYAKEAPKINELRAKLSYQNGVLNLLLSSANNSSLERLTANNEKLVNSVADIKAAIFSKARKNETPLISCHFDEQFQYELTREMMLHAEQNGQAWSSIGIGDWIQAGKWWLMKAQLQLYSTKLGSRESCQAYTDLLKASWILTDIIVKHPQLEYISNGSHLAEIQHFSSVIKTEHKRAEHHLGSKPQPREITKSDLTIWNTVSTTSLIPSLQSTEGQVPALWKTKSGEVLFQRFGTYLAQSVNSEIACIVILEMETDRKELNLIVQSFEGQDMIRYNVLEWEVLLNVHTTLDENRIQDDQYMLVITPTSRERSKVKVERLFFSDFHDARMLCLLLQHMPTFRLDFPDSLFELITLRGGALLQYLYILSKDGKHFSAPDVKNDIHILSGMLAESCSQKDCLDFWTLATHASGLNNHPVWFDDPYREPQTTLSLLSVACWASPTPEIFMATFNHTVPRGSKGFLKYVGESIRAAIYLQNGALLKSILKHSRVQPDNLEINPINTTDTFVKVILEHLQNIKELAGSHILLWVSFKRKRSGLFDALIKLNNGKVPDGFDHTMRTVIEQQDLSACYTISNKSVSLEVDFDGGSLMLYCLHLRFPEGFNCLLSLHPRLEHVEDYVLPALLTFDAGIIHSMKDCGYLTPNMDLCYEAPKGSGGSDDRGCFTVESVDRPIRRCKVLRKLHWYMEKGAPHLPLHAAVFLGCDARIIEDLVAAGALIMRRTFSRNTPSQVIEHVQKSVSLEDGRESFRITFAEIERLRRKYLVENYCMRGYHDSHGRTGFSYFMLTIDQICSAMKTVFNKSEAREQVLDKVYSDGGERRCWQILPKSLQTQESWTKWREEVCPILKEAFATQFHQEYDEIGRNNDVNQNEAVSHTSDNQAVRGPARLPLRKRRRAIFDW